MIFLETWHPHWFQLSSLHLCAKALQSCLTPCDPVHCSPPGSSAHGILQARTLEGVAISFSNAWKWKVKVKLLSRVRLLATPWTAAYQAPPSMGFSRQEYWSGVPWPSPSVAKLCPTLCNPLDCSMPGPLVLYYLLELAQTHVHRVGDAIQPSHLICRTLLLPSVFPSIRVFPNESALCNRWLKSWSFSFSIGPSSEYSGLTSFRTDWFDLLAVQVGLGKALLWIKLVELMEFQLKWTICQHPFLQTTFFPGPLSLLVISHFFPVTLSPLLDYLPSHLLYSTHLLIQMISYTSPYNNLIQVSAQESQVLKGTSTYPITPAKNYNDGLMVDDGWCLLLPQTPYPIHCHYQWTFQHNHSSIPFFNELNHWSFGFPGISVGKESTCNAGDLGSISGSGRFPWRRKGYPLQYFGLENSMDCIVYGVTKSRTQLSNFHFHWNTSSSVFFIYIFTQKSFLSKHLFVFIYLFIWPHQILVAAWNLFGFDMWGLVPWPGIEPEPPALGAQSLSHWTSRKSLKNHFLHVRHCSGFWGYRRCG